MTDWQQFLASCIASGVVLSPLCAMVVVPVVLWFGVRGLIPAIAKLNADPLWQAPLAAIAAMLPGLSFAGIAVQALLTTAHSPCLSYTSGRVIFGLVATLAIVALGRATLLAWRRHAEVRALFAAGVVPSARLAAIAEKIGVSVLTVDDGHPFCALAGAWKPSVFMSIGTEQTLSDSEIRAALLHEAAHRDRLDQIIGTIISFASDLLPLHVEELVAAYRRGREFAADVSAARQSDPLDLAAAIIRMSRAGVPVSAAGLAAEGGIVTARLQRLLTDAGSRPRRRRRVSVMLSLAMLATIAALPLIAQAFNLFQCSSLGPMT